MDVEVTLPQLSDEEDARATVNQWLVGEGEEVHADQDLVEVLTDKVAFTLPSPAGGRLTAVRAAVGAKVAFGDVLGVISSSE